MPQPITASKRVCKDCNAELPIAAFTLPTKKTKSGFTTVANCRDCRNGNTRQKRKDNPEPFRASDRKRYAKRFQRRKQRYHTDETFRNRELSRGRNWRKRKGIKSTASVKKHRSLFPTRRKELYQQNIEHEREVKRAAYHRVAPTVRTARSRVSRQAHRDRIRTSNRNRKAMLKNAEGFHTAKDIQALFEAQEGKCKYCGCILTKYHVDHAIPLTRGGTNWPSNLVIACPTCNVRKHNKLPHEFFSGGRLL